MTTWDGVRWRAAAVEVDRLLDLEAADRPVALAALAARDPALAADVRTLLEDLRAAQEEGFLDPEVGPVLPATTESAEDMTGPTPAGSFLEPQSVFGGYRIEGVLGRGGMGVVYDAREIESGRRVALKVLARRLTDERQRERFAREGRLAASIDHAHCVFVFAAMEEHGVPAIAMEPMHGTLADRLAAAGPFAATDVVEAARQLIAGLEAAAHAGILHRDVKPSNCFVDGEGTVKIGDFGISRSIRPTVETTLNTRGGISATPMYASPEQLRGDAVDVRSDIYSLGATLYELATGRRPFDAPDLMSLLMAVANDAPVPPAAVRPGIPSGLSAVILCCLAKQPADRFASYAALAEALEPYATTEPGPALVGRRVLAGVMDYVVVSLMTQWAVMILYGIDRRWWLAYAWLLPWPMLFAYFGVSEQLWAASPAKRLQGLTIAGPTRQPVSAARRWWRAALFVLLWQGAITVFGRALPSDFGDGSGTYVSPLLHRAPQLLTLLLLFVTARRANGYAAIHDLLSGTRVVERMNRRSAVGRPTATAAIDHRVTEELGAFAILAGDMPGWPGWHRGRDRRLRRDVWIRDSAPSTPPVSPARAALSRRTRLRWLAGRRTDRRAWDVFETVDGVPLAEACLGNRGWREVRTWLLDLSQELAALGPTERPPLAIDRLWILASGHLKLLDDPIADADRGRTADPSPAVFLREVTQRIASAPHDPWPASAERVVARLASTPTPPEEAARTLAGLASEQEMVTRKWRWGSLAAQVAVPLMLSGGGWLSLVAPSPSPIPRHAELTGAALEQAAAFHLLQRLHDAEIGRRHLSQTDRAAVTIALASHYRRQLSADTPMKRRLAPERRALLDRILQTFPPTTRIGDAARVPLVRGFVEPGWNIMPGWYLAVGGLYRWLSSAAVAALLLSLLFRTTLLRLIGLEIVTPDGRPASRPRVVWRTALAWLPVLAVTAATTAWGGWQPDFYAWPWSVCAAVLLQTAGAAFALARPTRSLQDRLAGTWLVPR